MNREISGIVIGLIAATIILIVGHKKIHYMSKIFGWKRIEKFSINCDREE